MSLLDLFETDVYNSEAATLERRRRIRLSLAAYAYEIMNDSIMSDAEYDKISLEINVDQATGNDKLDQFFKGEFSADTGQWIHKHPELDKLAAMYYCYKNPDTFRLGKRIYRLKE